MSTLRRRRVGDDADGSSAPQPRISLESFDLYTKTRVEEKEVSRFTLAVEGGVWLRARAREV